MNNPEKLATQGTQDEDNKRQRIPKGQSKMNNPEKLATQGTQDEDNKRQRIPKGQSKMNNPEKLATQGTQYKEKLNTICVGHYNTQTNTNNVNKT